MNSSDSAGLLPDFFFFFTCLSYKSTTNSFHPPVLRQNLQICFEVLVTDNCYNLAAIWSQPAAPATVKVSMSKLLHSY